MTPSAPRLLDSLGALAAAAIGLLALAGWPSAGGSPRSTTVERLKAEAPARQTQQ